jgi:hypothetical protein
MKCEQLCDELLCVCIQSWLWLWAGDAGGEDGVSDVASQFVWHEGNASCSGAIVL